MSGSPKSDRGLPVLLVFSGLALLYLICGTTGYSGDYDTFLMLNSFDILQETGEYSPSRRPGFLVPEILIGSFASIGGYLLSNFVVAILAVSTLFFLYTFLRRKLSNSESLLVILIVGLNPWWVSAASSSADFVYSLFFFAVGAKLLGGKGHLFAPLFFACSVSSRITIVPVIGLLYLFWLARDGLAAIDYRKALAHFIPLTVLLVLAYLPSVLHLGFAAFSFNMNAEHQSFFGPSNIDWGLKEFAARFGYKNIYFFGLPSTLLLCGLVGYWVLAWRRIQFDKIQWFAVLCIVYFEVVFFRLPHKTYYLIPVLFLVGYLVVTLRPPKALLYLLVCLQLLSCLVKIDLLSIQYKSNSYIRIDAESAEFKPNFKDGILLSDLKNRKAALQAYIDQRPNLAKFDK